MEGRTHVFAGIVQGKCTCKKVKEESDASPALIATDEGKRISNKQKMVAGSKSSSSSDDDYRCSSCPRQFSCQQALAGHRNIHRGEWESHLDEPDHDKADPRCKLPTKTAASPVSNPIAALKWQSFRNSSSMQPLVCAPKSPLSKPANVQKGAATRAPLNHVAKPTNAPICDHRCRSLVKHTNTLIEPSPRHPLVNPTNTLKGPSPRYPLVKPTNNHNVQSPRPYLARPTYTHKGPSPLYHLVNSTNTLQASPTNTLKEPSPKCHLPHPRDAFTRSLSRYPLANPTNTFKSSLASAPPNFSSNATNTLLQPSLKAPQQPFAGKPPHMPSIRDPNRPLNNCAKPHGKLALGVRYESMIHKPCQCRRVGQSDMVLRTGSSLPFDRKHMMGDNIMGFSTNNNHANVRYLLTVSGSDSTSKSEGGGNSKAHYLNSSSFQPRGGKEIKAHDLFPLNPTHEIHRHDNAHSSQGHLPQPDLDGEDVDLNLKL